MARTRQIPREEWTAFLEWFNREQVKDAARRDATVEVLSPAIGNQVEATALPMLGLDFDPKSDLFEVYLEDLDHLASSPAELWVVEEDDGFIPEMQLVRGDGYKEILHLRRGGPLAHIVGPMSPR